MKSVLKPVTRVLNSAAEVAEESSGVLVNVARYGRVRTDEWVAGAHGSSVVAAEEHVTNLAERLAENEKRQAGLDENHVQRARALLAAAAKSGGEVSAYEISAAI